MILALETGWTPNTLAALPAWFRDACHWALYIRSVLPEGIVDHPIDPSMSTEAKLAAAKKSIANDKIREAIYPADE